jgi:hypothetical protein
MLVSKFFDVDAYLVNQLWLLFRLRVEHRQQIGAKRLANGGGPVVGQAVQRQQRTAPDLVGPRREEKGWEWAEVRRNGLGAAGRR